MDWRHDVTRVEPAQISKMKGHFGKTNEFLEKTLHEFGCPSTASGENICDGLA